MKKWSTTAGVATKDIGRMAVTMAKACSHTETEIPTQAGVNTVRKKATAHTSSSRLASRFVATGLRERYTRANGSILTVITSKATSKTTSQLARVHGTTLMAILYTEASTRRRGKEMKILKNQTLKQFLSHQRLTLNGTRQVAF